MYVIYNKYNYQMDKYDNYSNEQSASSHNASVDECQYEYEYDDYQHDEYINIKHNSFIPFTKPKNTLDILRLSSDKYEQYKHTEHIKQIISQFSFDNKIVDEIIKASLFYKDKLHLHLNDLVPIIVYKVIQKYNYPYTKAEILSKIKFNISIYLKYSQHVHIESIIGSAISSNNDNNNNNNSSNSNNNSSLKDNVYTHVNYAFNKLIELSSIKPGMFKLNKKNVNVDALYLKLMSGKEGDNKYCDVPSMLMELKVKAKKLIYDDDNVSKDKDTLLHSNFNEFFIEKINYRYLAISIVRFLLMGSNVNVNLSNLQKVFFVSCSSITKGVHLVRDYIKLNQIKL